MSIELYISSSPHETKVAVLEDDRLVEVYYERDTDVGLVGGIYKGRVSRVLPGMQSAFVDIGLERDAFLHVSELFLEDQEEYDKIFEEAEARAIRYVTEEARASEPKPLQVAPATSEGESAGGAPAPAGSPAETLSAARPAEAARVERTPSVPGSAPTPARYGRDSGDYRQLERRGRRPRRGRGFTERGFVPRPQSSAPHTFEILPGESLAKYSHVTQELQPQATTEGTPREAPATAPAAATQAEETVPGPSVLPVESIPQEVAPSAGSVGEVEAPPPETPTAALPTENVSSSLTATEAAPSTSTADFLEVSSPKAAPPEAIPPAVSEARQTAKATEPSSLSDQASVSGPAPVQTEPTTRMSVRSESSPAPTSTTGPTSEPQAGVQPTSPEVTATPAERTYTLREPYQRPRYAPRRGRRGLAHRGQHLEGRQESQRPGSIQPRQITELLKEGQEILVQIAKEPLGTKGARVTSYIALPGRYLVYMPTIDHVGVSRRIVSEQERLRLRNIILENRDGLSGGFIVRTAGEGRSEEEFKADLKFLSTLWAEIKGKTERTKAPALVHRDLDLVQRILRDIMTPEFKCIRVDSEVEYERVVEFVSRCQPSLIGHVKLYTRDAPLFEEFGIQEEIEKALKPKVWLKSGGYIVINQTEALVAIDVNTGKYVGKTNRLEDTIVKTNIDAVQEIVRQIRLRDLGGIIVIDFIDMDERRNRLKVVQALEEALRRDRAPTKLISFHDFGLVAITRKRVKQSLERTLCEPCHYCTGAGWIKSVTTVCYEILAEARKMARQIEGNTINLRVNPEVAKALKSREGILISDLESLTHKDVIIRSDPTVHQERYEIF